MTSDNGFVLWLTGPSKPPLHPELILHTGRESVDEPVARLLTWLEQRGLASSRDTGAYTLRVRGNGEPIRPR